MRKQQPGQPAQARSRAAQPPAPPVSDAEWESVAGEMRRHMPQAWARLEQVPPARQARMKRMFVERFRELQRLAQREPEQYRREIELVELEDEVFGLARQLWPGAARGGDDRGEVRKALREKVGQLVDLRIRNREARIERLAKALETERGRLEADKRNREVVVERQFNAMANGEPIPGVPGSGAAPGNRRPPREQPTTGADVSASPDTPGGAKSK
jgi:hypothetical protein